MSRDMDRISGSIGIYIHIPFCRSKCYYCDFNSYAGREHLAGSYFDALYREMALRSRYIGGRRVSSVFIGGGTPSLVDAAYITRLIGLCRECFHVDDDAEISIESNPGTLTWEKLQAYRDAGVNRLSIGLQAWQDRILESIGRIHTVRQFAENLEAAVKCGFDNINVDLIFGLPGQTPEDWRETLEAVTEFGTVRYSPAANDSAAHKLSGHGLVVRMPEKQRSEGAGSPVKHISCYSLKIEEGTVFGDRLEAGSLEPVDDETDREMYHMAVDMLAEKGYRQYEISNFAVPGYECRHNLLYWKAKEYAGFGSGAHSYLDGVRFSNVTGIEEYIRAVDSVCGRHGSGPVQVYIPGEMGGLHENIEVIDREEAMSEFMILGLRLTDGVSSAEFEERFGERLEDRYGEKLRRLAAKGLIEAVAVTRPAGDSAEGRAPAENVGRSGAVDSTNGKVLVNNPEDNATAGSTEDRSPEGGTNGKVLAASAGRRTPEDNAERRVPGNIIDNRTEESGAGTGTGSEATVTGAGSVTHAYSADDPDQGGRILVYRLTRQGLDLANSVFVEFI